jgi:hypothetical protein
MLIRGMNNLPLIISICLIIGLLIIFPLFISYKAERKKSEWDKIRNYANKINNRVRKKKY